MSVQVQLPREGLFRGICPCVSKYLFEKSKDPKEAERALYMTSTVLGRIKRMSSLGDIFFGMDHDTKKFHIEKLGAQFYHEPKHPGDLTGFNIEDVISLSFDTFGVANWSASFGNATLTVTKAFYAKLFPQVLGKSNIYLREDDSTVTIGNLTIAMPSIMDAAKLITGGNTVTLLMNRSSGSAFYYFDVDKKTVNKKTFVLSIDLKTGKLQFVSESIDDSLVIFDAYKLRESAKAGLLPNLTDDNVCQLVVEALVNMQAEPQLLKLYLESQ